MAFEAYKHAFRLVWADKDRHESFITHVSNGSTSLYRCELCDKSFRGDRVDEHCCKSAHHSRVDQIRVLQSDYMTHTCAMLRHRADQLGLKAWQMDVQSKLFWTLLNRGVEEPGAALRSATALLEKYEQRERISLLELAAWKATCILHPELRPPAIKRKGYLAWLDWARNGWKENKAALRNANELSIIVMSIMPFLGPEAAGEPPARPRVRFSLPADARERDEVQGAHRYRFLDDHSTGVINDFDIAAEHGRLGFIQAMDYLNSIRGNLAYHDLYDSDGDESEGDSGPQGN
jgi:hypothetical protein